ncbi:Uncharacterised protein [Mycobacterium tuberculosis]|uniref:Lipoprotein n=1 Tax=Mycobacterium tuberculosis TaxID=1773 RepID=A0A0T7LMJ6_MYCTX|nr:Uncharacterised protein [Mycobacterium tuberculosis]CKS76627.1 Uncharacterised protein [Mycobacterium tuberculosis]CKT16134.1 Uncharacterised protein [Mycobacterium tuberculosis]CKT44821.1 Uncharacterised protein [Mycobacterium tuberculosis]CKW22812.1 Uncharacterised protein [Mycobacterium tuberculosis]
MSKTGFIAASGVVLAASACTHCARPISTPVPSGPRQTIELLDMFCALNGATRTPRRANARHSPAVTALLPASLVVPATSRPDIRLPKVSHSTRVAESVSQVPGIIGVRGLPPNASLGNVISPATCPGLALWVVPAKPRVPAP